MAYRFAWERVHGQVQEGQVICHRCDNPACVNADHLFLGTQADNVRDMVAKGRAASGSRHSQSKLIECDIPRVRDLIRLGVIHKEIGRWFGVHRRTISDIARSKTWVHI